MAGELKITSVFFPLDSFRAGSLDWVFFLRMLIDSSLIQALFAIVQLFQVNSAVSSP